MTPSARHAIISGQPRTSQPHFRKNETFASHPQVSHDSPHTIRAGLAPRSSSSTWSKSMHRSSSSKRPAFIASNMLSRSVGNGNKSIQGWCRTSRCNAVGINVFGHEDKGFGRSEGVGPSSLYGDIISSLHNPSGGKPIRVAFRARAFSTFSRMRIGKFAGRGECKLYSS